MSRSTDYSSAENIRYENVSRIIPTGFPTIYSKSGFAILFMQIACANAAADNKQTRPGHLKFSDSVSQRRSYFRKKKCMQQSRAMRHSTENAVFEMTIVKGARVMLERRLRHLHQPRETRKKKNSSMPASKNIDFIAFVAEWRSDFSSSAICKHVNI